MFPKPVSDRFERGMGGVSGTIRQTVVFRAPAPPRPAAAQAAHHEPSLTHAERADVLAAMEAFEPDLIHDNEATEDTRKAEGHPEERPSILRPEGPSLTHPISVGLSSVGLTYRTVGGSPNANPRDWGSASDFAPDLGTGGDPRRTTVNSANPLRSSSRRPRKPCEALAGGIMP